MATEVSSIAPGSQEAFGLAMLITQNPEQAAQILASKGISPQQFTQLTGQIVPGGAQQSAVAQQSEATPPAIAAATEQARNGQRGLFGEGMSGLGASGLGGMGGLWGLFGGSTGEPAQAPGIFGGGPGNIGLLGASNELARLFGNFGKAPPATPAAATPTPPAQTQAQAEAAAVPTGVAPLPPLPTPRPMDQAGGTPISPTAAMGASTADRIGQALSGVQAMSGENQTPMPSTPSATIPQTRLADDNLQQLLMAMMAQRGKGQGVPLSIPGQLG